MVSWLSCFTYSESLSSALYKPLRLLMGFSRFIGIGTLLIQSLSLVSWHLMMEILQDLSGLISIRVHLMLPWSLSSRHLENALVEVIVVMSPINSCLARSWDPSPILFFSSHSYSSATCYWNCADQPCHRLFCSEAYCTRVWSVSKSSAPLLSLTWGYFSFWRFYSTIWWIQVIVLWPNPADCQLSFLGCQLHFHSSHWF